MDLRGNFHFVLFKHNIAPKETSPALEVCRVRRSWGGGSPDAASGTSQRKHRLYESAPGGGERNFSNRKDSNSGDNDGLVCC